MNAPKADEGMNKYKKKMNPFEYGKYFLNKFFSQKDFEP